MIASCCWFKMKRPYFNNHVWHSFPRNRIRVKKKAAPTPTRTQRGRRARPLQNLHGNLHGGGDKPLRFKVPPINTKFISSAEHWKTSTYLSFIVFLWHFCAARKARSADFIWIKASPDGRPYIQGRQKEMFQQLPWSSSTAIIYVVKSSLFSHKYILLQSQAQSSQAPTSLFKFSSLKFFPSC